MNIFDKKKHVLHLIKTTYLFFSKCDSYVSSRLKKMGRHNRVLVVPLSCSCYQMFEKNWKINIKKFWKQAIVRLNIHEKFMCVNAFGDHDHIRSEKIMYVRRSILGNQKRRFDSIV